MNTAAPSNNQQPTNQQQANPAPPPGQSISDRKKYVIDVLQKKFAEPIWMDRLLKICGGDDSRIMKSLNSFIAYVMNDDGGGERGEKKYIAMCTISSICTAFLEAFQMGIEVGGGRDHAYLVNYAGQCELEISYKGFVYALGKHFDNPFVVAENVFEGDEFTCEISDTNASYRHKPGDPFSKTWDKMRGCYCYFSYTQRDNKEKVSRLVMIQRAGPDGLEMIRSKSKGSFAWKDFPFEQTKKSTLRRAAKIPFAAIDFSDETISPETQDNKHYQLEASGTDRLALLMQKQKELNDDEKPKPDDKGGAAGNHHGTAPGSEQPQNAGQKAPAPGNNEMPTQGAAETVLPPPAEGDAPAIDHESRYEDISDAEFTDSSSQEPLAQAAQNPAPMPAEMSSVMPAVEPAPALAPTGGVWDGKTLYMPEGKKHEKDFASARAALVYLRKVIGSRKHKASRKELIDLNPLLMGALIREGKGSEIALLHQLADQGE